MNASDIWQRLTPAYDLQMNDGMEEGSSRTEPNHPNDLLHRCGLYRPFTYSKPFSYPAHKNKWIREWSRLIPC